MKTWFSFDDYIKESDNYPWVGLRHIKGLGKKVYTRMSSSELFDILIFEDISINDYVITEVNPPCTESQSGIQGELTWATSNTNRRGLTAGWLFYYTTDLRYMRDALNRSGSIAYGLEVATLIERYCDVSDCDMLFDLFDLYTDESLANPYPVIEFSALNRTCGIQNRKTVIWEIRNNY
jgi:hypothetical protein